MSMASDQPVCSICGQNVAWFDEWQAVTGRAFLGHRGCTETEAAKWVMVERSVLTEVREELSRWGMGDMHYGAQPQEQSVVDAVAKLDAVLNAGSTNVESS